MATRTHADRPPSAPPAVVLLVAVAAVVLLAVSSPGVVAPGVVAPGVVAPGFRCSCSGATNGIGPQSVAGNNTSTLIRGSATCINDAPPVFVVTTVL